MKVTPIAATKPHWASIQNVLGYSVTQFLDQQEIDLESFIAFPFALHNKKSLEAFSPILDHVSVSFLIETQTGDDLLHYNLYIYNLRILSYSDMILLVSGTINQWTLAVNIGCRKSVDKQTREIMNEVYNFFSRAGLKQLWENQERLDQPDGTFILV